MIRKIAGPADVMDREEAESKILQYSQLWQLYAEISVELKKKSELSQESAVAACKMYGPYISDILRQVDEVMKIFAMEKELRIIRNRGYFAVPLITPHGNKVETTRDKEKVLEAVDDEVTEMLTALKQSEENYEREQEQARIRDEQLRLARQTNRSDFNLVTLANSTPIRNDNTRSDQPGVHFNNKAIRHIYSANSMTSGDNQYEPPANDSILQGAVAAPTDQFATNATGTTDRNDLWRHNSGINTARHTATQGRATRPTGHKWFPDGRNGLTCFKCGEQGHMRMDCREREFSAHFANPTTTTQKHAEGNTTTSQVPLTATSQWDTTQQQPHHL